MYNELEIKIKDVIFEDYDLQIHEEDDFCQTWIWFYVFLRVIYDCERKTIFSNLTKMDKNQLLNLISEFWKQLLNENIPIKSIYVPEFCKTEELTDKEYDSD